MRIVPWTTLSLVIDGDELACARVSGTIFGVRARPAARICGLVQRGAGTARGSDEARRALAMEAADGGGGRITLTIPAQWCSLRPIALRCERWGLAREEVVRSLSGLFPLAPTDAMVGLIDRRGVWKQGVGGVAGAGGGRGGGGGVGGEVGGYLVVIDRARVAPWLEEISRALGREVDEVLAPQMAMLGLGLQVEERAEVIEVSPGGSVVAHRLALGEIVELSRPFDAAESAESMVTLRLGGIESASDTGRLVDAEQLAVAAGLAGRVAPGRYCPLMGSAPRGAARWAVPVAAAALALGAMWGANWTGEARYRRAVDEMDRTQLAARTRVQSVERDRTLALRLVDLLDSASRGPVAGARSVLSDLAAAQSALGSDGFMYRVEVDRSGVSLRGEATRASDILNRLESTPGFRSARNLSTAGQVEERGLEMFDVRAERTPTGAAKGAAR